MPQKIKNDTHSGEFSALESKRRVFYVIPSLTGFHLAEDIRWVISEYLASQDSALVQNSPPGEKQAE